MNATRARKHLLYDVQIYQLIYLINFDVQNVQNQQDAS